MPLVNVTPGELARIRQVLGRDTTPPPPTRRRRRADGAATGGVVVRKNSTGTDSPVSGTRRRLNLIEGANVILTVADDSLNDEVDVTVAAAVYPHAYRGKLDGDLSYGGSATMSIWYWNGTSEADSGADVTVYDWLLTSGQSVTAGTQVVAVYDSLSGRYYVTGAQCV